MKTYIVNLPDSTERLASLRKRLEAHPYIEAEVLEAVDGRKMSDEQLRKAFDYEGFRKAERRYPRPGEVGCTLSHQKFYQRVVTSGEPALVLEDDIYIERNIEEELQWASGWLATDKPRIVLFGAACLYRQSSGNEIGNGTAGKLVKPAFYCHGAFAYAINPIAAALMINQWPGHTSDNFIMFHKRYGIDIRVFVPNVIMPADETQSSTTIAGAGERIQFGFPDRLYFFLRAKRNRFLVKSGLYKRQDTIDFRPV